MKQALQKLSPDKKWLIPSAGDDDILRNNYMPRKKSKIEIKPLNLLLNFLNGFPENQGKKKPLRFTMTKHVKAKEIRKQIKTIIKGFK